jgi:hypothetical protein
VKPAALTTRWRGYQRRVDAGGWREEIWYSLYQIGCLHQSSAATGARSLKSLLAAYEFDPSRLEPLYLLVQHYRDRGQYNSGYLLARVFPETAYPSNGLFVERDIYAYKLPLEYAICCHYVGQFAEALRVNDELLNRPGVPTEYREAATRNRRFSFDALRKKNIPSVTRKAKSRVGACRSIVVRMSLRFMRATEPGPSAGAPPLRASSLLRWPVKRLPLRASRPGYSIVSSAISVASLPGPAAASTSNRAGRAALSVISATFFPSLKILHADFPWH